MCNKDDVRQAIGLAALGKVDVSAIATHVLPIEQAQRGMEEVGDNGPIVPVVWAGSAF